MFEFIMICITGYVAGLCGFFPGMIIGRAAEKAGKRFQGLLMGFTGGLLIAFICFEMLPTAFGTHNLYIGTIGILIGVLCCVYIEEKINETAKKSQNLKIESMKTALLLTFGISLHNIPEGMAIGSIARISFQMGLRLAAVIAIHCVAEGIAISMPLNKSGSSIKMILVYTFVLALPLSLGSAIGAVLGMVSSIFVTLSLSFAGGVMLYIACGEVIPNSKKIWSGRLSTIFGVFGFVLGILLTSGI